MRPRPSPIQGSAADPLVGQFQRLVQTVARHVDQAQAAERQRGAVAALLPGNVDDLETAATQIASQAVGIEEAHHDALGGELGLALARQDVDRDAERVGGVGDEGGALVGIAHGGGGDRAAGFNAEHGDDHTEALEG